MYELSDATIENELMTKSRQGVRVRVLLDDDYYGRSDNERAFSALRQSTVSVQWAPPGQIFHAKYLVIDQNTAFIGTGNLDAADYSSTRDFWVEDTSPSDVTAIEATFGNDFSHVSRSPRFSQGLVWSPGSMSSLVGLISSARTTLLVENEEMDSTSIEQSLIDAARRGVNVSVVMTYDSSWKAALLRLTSAGVHVRVLNSRQIYVHAKVLCVDCGTKNAVAFVGSENFSTSSLSYNRELGVVTSTPVVVTAVENAVRTDFAQGAPLA
jgi:phosphatidylserine/phosphatidylglycerophosphate/cardiolipin synthase-like enzyme